MANSDDHFEEFEAHTRLKHLILKAYLTSWAFKMLLRPGGGDRAYFLDACAGAGMDDVGNHGSPVLAAIQAAIARDRVHTMTGRDVDVITVAVEKKQTLFRALKQNLEPFGSHARALHGELREFLPDLLDEIGDAPILCFIDPFGVEPLRAEVVRAILGRPHCEAFVLFHDQGCLRHYGAAAAAEPGETSEPSDLFGDMIERPPRLPPRGEAAERALQVTAARAIEILDAAFDVVPWRARIDAVPATNRRAEFVRMYREFLLDCGATFVQPIPIRNNDNQHVYYLIYASKSATGLETMKEAVSAALRRTELNVSAADTIRFAIRSPLQRIAGELAARFAGRTMPWTSANAEGLIPLGKYVLRETPVFPHEIPELKGLLKPYKLPGNKLVYAFPGTPVPGIVTPSERARWAP
jgi:three-Cys-motif partner protein